MTQADSLSLCLFSACGLMFRYSLYQVVSCLLVCGGIVLLTLADAGARTLPGCCDTPSIPLQTKVQAAHHAASDSYDASNSTSILALLSPTWLSSLHAGPLLSSLLSLDLFGSTDLRWLVGILMLTLTLFLLAFLGHEQERVYARYGKVWREVMFYQHLVSLPFCMVMGKDIWTHVVDWMKPQTYASVAVPFIGEMRVSLFAFLALNLLTQTVCFKGVSMLTAHCGALTIALALTVRKFLSLLLSILYFNNQFTQRHWSGAILVFIGIGAYTNEQSCRRLWERIGGGSNSSGAKATIAAAQADSLKLTNGVGSHASLSPSSTVELPSELDLLASPNALAVAKSTSPDGMRSRAAASKRAASPRRKSSSGGAVDRSSSSKKKTSTRTRSSSQRS